MLALEVIKGSKFPTLRRDSWALRGTAAGVEVG
jgi:hypothetical protein